VPFEREEIADDTRTRQRREQAHFIAGEARAGAERVRRPGCGLDRLFGCLPAEIAGSQERHHVGRKQQRREPLGIAARIGALEVGGVGRHEIDQPAIDGSSDAADGAEGGRDFEGRQFHEPSMILRVR